MFSLILKPGPRYSWKKAALILVLATFLSSGAAWGVFFGWRYFKKRQIEHSTEVIQAIIQTSSQKGEEHTALPSGWFAEVLDLSIDSPSKLGPFDLLEAKKRLLASHILKEVKLKKVKPDALLIQYKARTPLLVYQDYANTLMDEEGIFFPYAPFYTPQELPTISLKNEFESPWGEKIEAGHLDLIEDFFDLLGKASIKKIDLSRIHAPTCGKKELIVVLKTGTILRLNPKNYRQQLINYSILKATFKGQNPKIVDLRLPEVAYVNY